MTCAVLLQVYQQLLSERNTWRLVGSLFSERLGEETKDSSMMMEGEEGEPKTDMEVVTHMYDVNPTVREVCTTQPFQPLIRFLYGWQILL